MADEAKPPETDKPTAPAPEGSAPTDKVSAAPAPQVEAGAKTSPDAAKRAIEGLKTDLFKARSKGRSYEETTAQINARLASLEAKLSEASRAKPDKDSWAETQPGDEPAKGAVTIDQIGQVVSEKLNGLQAEYQLKADKAEATNWLLSREHLRADPNAVKEMADILELPHFQELKEKHPRAAARAAYVEWCEQRGVTPDVGNTKTDKPTDSPKPSAGKKVDDDGVDASLLKGVQYGTKEYEERVKAIEQAVREGKYKGKTIKIR